jgi:hypothetical protein
MYPDIYKNDTSAIGTYSAFWSLADALTFRSVVAQSSKPGQAIPQIRPANRTVAGDSRLTGTATYATDTQAAPESLGPHSGCMNIIKRHNGTAYDFEKWL